MSLCTCHCLLCSIKRQIGTKTDKFFKDKNIGRQQGSNPWPSDWQPKALPTELHPLTYKWVSKLIINLSSKRVKTISKVVNFLSLSAAVTVSSSERFYILFFPTLFKAVPETSDNKNICGICCFDVTTPQKWVEVGIKFGLNAVDSEKIFKTWFKLIIGLYYLLNLCMSLNNHTNF